MISTYNDLNNLFYQDIISISNNFLHEGIFEFQIQRYFKEFILIYKDQVIPFNKLNELQFENTLQRLDLMRANFMNENWHREIKEFFMQNGFYFNIDDSNKYAMSCILNNKNCDNGSFIKS